MSIKQMNWKVTLLTISTIHYLIKPYVGCQNLILLVLLKSKKNVFLYYKYDYFK